MHLILALLMALLIGGAAGYLGSLMLTKRMSLVAGPLGHLTLPGIAIALRYNFDVFFGALLFIALGSVIIWFFQKKTDLPFEAITAVVFALSLSIAFLFLPHKHSSKALLGDLSQITLPMTCLTIFLCLVLIFITYKIAPHIMLATISNDLAHVRGIHMPTIHLIYMISIALLIALGSRIVGGLMTAALVAIPACTSNNLVAANMRNYMYLSMLCGLLSCGIGVILHATTSTPIGPAIVLTSGLFFIASIVIKKRT